MKSQEGKIYDCFLFFNELDLLEIRLEILYEKVDFFVISECDSTFSGLKKPFYFEENKNRFTKYLDKIIHLKHFSSEIYDDITNPYTGEKGRILDEILKNYHQNIRFSEKTDYGKEYWCREFLHREYVKLGMIGCSDSDLIIFSDLDEIPDGKFFPADTLNYCLKQKNMIYYFNLENQTEEWFGPVMCQFSYIRDKSLNQIRTERLGYNRIESGWHLTFMGGESRIKEKIMSYSHQEYNNSRIYDSLSQNLRSNVDILGRNLKIIKIKIDDYFPEKIIHLISEKFNYLIND